MLRNSTQVQHFSKNITLSTLWNLFKNTNKTSCFLNVEHIYLFGKQTLLSGLTLRNLAKVTYGNMFIYVTGLTLYLIYFLTIDHL